MAAGRVKRETNAPKRYMDEVFQELSSQRKAPRVKADRKLYPVIVTDVEKIGKRVKIHYVDYCERYDEWRPCGTDEILFQRMEPLCIPSPSSLDDRTELVHGELYREIKKNTCILAERTIQQLALKFELIGMCLMEGLH